MRKIFSLRARIKTVQKCLIESFISNTYLFPCKLCRESKSFSQQSIGEQPFSTYMGDKAEESFHRLPRQTGRDQIFRNSMAE